MKEMLQVEGDASMCLEFAQQPMLLMMCHI